jgi:hypothetical protein
MFFADSIRNSHLAKVLISEVCWKTEQEGNNNINDNDNIKVAEFASHNRTRMNADATDDRGYVLKK